jgi:hypothetical protein
LCPFQEQQWARNRSHCTIAKLGDDVELAVAGGAAMIVTNHIRHFCRGELRFPELRSVTPREASAETRFRSLAGKVSTRRGLELLDKLDRAFSRRRSPAAPIKRRDPG